MNTHFWQKRRPSAPRVFLRPNLDKIIAAISFLIKEAEAIGMTPSQYDIGKSIFMADRSHLNAFGRPITYDNYVAMKHGPVPSLAYDLLKANTKALREHNIVALPWKRTDAPKGYFHYSEARTENVSDVLSPSAMDALSSALSDVARLSFGEIRARTHKDPAYTEAWDAVGEKGCNPMSLGLLFNAPNHEAAKAVAFSSKQSAATQNVDDEFDIPADLGESAGS